MIIRHDVRSSAYLAEESDWPAVFPLHRRAWCIDSAATLIAPGWAVTAAHCTADIHCSIEDGIPFPIAIDNCSNSICEVIVHPSFGDLEFHTSVFGRTTIDLESETDLRFDIALLRLTNPVNGVEPVKISGSENEIDQVVQLPGWGFSGTGDQGVSIGLLALLPPYDFPLRVVHNKISEVSETLIIFIFDTPGDEACLPLEGVPGPGDSGGPAISRSNGCLKIIGISSHGDYPVHLRKTSKRRTGRYGWKEYFVRMSAMESWINSIVKA